MTDIKKKLFLAVFMIATLFVAGVAGYVLVEGWTVFDAIYMTVITVATVGYGEVHPLSPYGRVFTIFLILFGMGTFIYALSTITAFILEGEFGGYLRRKKVKSRIGKLENHYIVCGSGDIARYVVRELHKCACIFVVVDNHPENIERFREDIREDVLWLEGNPAEDRVLLEAGVERAKGFISALETDKDNLIVVMTARSLNPKVRIVTRAVDECCAAKMSKAGADAVVSTEFIGGMRMASELIRPSVVSFLDKMLRGSDSTFRVEEIEVKPDSSLVGKTVGDANICDRAGLALVAVKSKKSGTYDHVPRSSRVITADDILIVIGSPERIENFRRL